MSDLVFRNLQGDFSISGGRLPNDLYFPLVNNGGMMSSITPELGGDSKHDQNSFLLAPATRESLKNTKSTRNFWCAADGKMPWSVSGRSPWQQVLDKDAENVTLEGGLLWQRVTRENKAVGLKASVLSFVPSGNELMELMQVTISNISGEDVSFTPIAAIPIYGRSADNIRDHRHVTSLLNRMDTTEYGVSLTPTLTFDERGHRINTLTYGVYASKQDANGNIEKPVDFCPVADEFTGETGSFELPEFVVKGGHGVISGTKSEGFEAIGAIRFAKTTLKKGESVNFQIIMSIGAPNLDYLKAENVAEALGNVKASWDAQAAVVSTGDSRFDSWIRWVSVQPVLRRICGCSFMPDHDYGRGGRGWRDLWQDCLGLLLRSPDSQKGKLTAYTEGIRIDGSNATIIGTKDGEFIADRNHIVRVWMDHGVWATRTIHVYIQQTQDIKMLLEKRSYFKDVQAMRGEGKDSEWTAEQGTRLLTKDRNVYQGSVLEHLLIQNITAFLDVGEHNHIRLRGADWNDALDMASERGESVAFTAAYADNFNLLADCVDMLARKSGVAQVTLCAELCGLLEQAVSLFDKPDGKRAALNAYCDSVRHSISGKEISVDCNSLSAQLRNMANWILEHIRKEEWISCDTERGWFNGYYDNNGRKVESADNDNLRMMLTGQVFTILSGVSTDEQTRSVINAVDKYLFHPERGGYCLNTNFDEVKLDMGRLFGFAYGHKENGAVFSHMAVMYAYALYSRGFAEQGWKVLSALYEQSADFSRSRILPGIPEYFDISGKGMYPYLTGAASWYIFTLQTQVFGVRGDEGDLLLSPKLITEQFDSDGKASICVDFADALLEVVYINTSRKSYGEYVVSSAKLDGQSFSGCDGAIRITRENILCLAPNIKHRVEVIVE